MHNIEIVQYGGYLTHGHWTVLYDPPDCLFETRMRQFRRWDPCGSLYNYILLDFCRNLFRIRNRNGIEI